MRHALGLLGFGSEIELQSRKGNKNAQDDPHALFSLLAFSTDRGRG